MTSYEKTLEKVLLGTSDANIRFADLRTLLLALGFRERIKGSHHIFSREGVDEILNLQPVGSKAKAYQVRDVRGVILNYGLVSNAEE
ncbi:MAG TPA: type II toxin-antitoxin system HicA family toxin [Longimicrobiales bacterium]|nr:type II toxin-antitoxin system HicA family toxin [Longimicrobiales bacterium]